MKSVIIYAIICVMALSIVPIAHAKRKAPDEGITIVSQFVCSELCQGNESIYVYEGVSDDARCKEIGGEMYSSKGWETLVVCKVMNKKRCAENEGHIGEFHVAFNAKNFTHLGCAETMTPDECRALLRESYAEKSTANKYFMNNIGCLVR